MPVNDLSNSSQVTERGPVAGALSGTLRPYPSSTRKWLNSQNKTAGRGRRGRSASVELHALRLEPEQLGRPHHAAGGGAVAAHPASLPELLSGTYLP